MSLNVLPLPQREALRRGLMTGGVPSGVGFGKPWLLYSVVSGERQSAVRFMAAATVQNHIQQNDFERSRQFAEYTVTLRVWQEGPRTAKLGDVVKSPEGDEYAITAIVDSDVPRWECRRITTLAQQAGENFRAEGGA